MRDSPENMKYASSSGRAAGLLRLDCLKVWRQPEGCVDCRWCLPVGGNCHTADSIQRSDGHGDNSSINSWRPNSRIFRGRARIRRPGARSERRVPVGRTGRTPVVQQAALATADHGPVVVSHNKMNTQHHAGSVSRSETSQWVAASAGRFDEKRLSKRPRRLAGRDQSRRCRPVNESRSHRRRLSAAKAYCRDKRWTAPTSAQVKTSPRRIRSQRCRGSPSAQ